MNNLLRTLFITKEVPYPPMGGVSLRNWQNINLMKQWGEVGVFSASNWTPQFNSLPDLNVWLHCNVEKKRSQLHQLKKRFWWLYANRHPDADWCYGEQAAQELRLLLTEFQPNLVIIEQVWLYPYLKVIKEYPCAIIFDAHNLELDLARQEQIANNNLKNKLKQSIKLAHLEVMEKELMQQLNQVWVCSHDDGNLAQQIYGKIAPIEVIPNGINVNNYQDLYLKIYPVPEGLENNRYNLLFLGQLSYLPNQIAAEILLETIYPQVKQIYPETRLLLVGRNPHEKLLKAAQKDQDIMVTGGIPDVKPYLAAANIMIVPLTQGGGTRLKILEAFASGCPVISTKKGAEGLAVKHREHLLICDDVDDIIQGICELWTDNILAQKLADSAYELVKNQYSWEAIQNHIDKGIKKLL